jgi:putative membrane protein
MLGPAFCNGMGVGGWLLMIGFWAAVFGLAVWALTRVFPAEQPLRDARRALDERLAAGEIDPQTYRVVRDELTEAGPRRAERR